MILTIFLVATLAFVLTDPRWTGQLATPIQASWVSTTLVYGGSEDMHTTRLDPEERCVFASRWLAEREERSEIVQRAELQAAERVLASCQEHPREGARDRTSRGTDGWPGPNLNL